MCLSATSLTNTKNLKKNIDNYSFYKEVCIKVVNNKIELHAPVRGIRYDSRTIECGETDPKKLIEKQDRYWAKGYEYSVSKGVHFYALPKGGVLKSEDGYRQYVRCTVDVKDIVLVGEKLSWLANDASHVTATKIKLDSRSLQNLVRRVRRNPKSYIEDVYNFGTEDVEMDIFNLEDSIADHENYIEDTLEEIEKLKQDIQDLKMDLADAKKDLAEDKKRLQVKEKELEELKTPKTTAKNTKLTLSI